MVRLRAMFAGRPWWLNAIWLFCLYMTFVYLPFDLFYKPVERDEEVWFGFVLHGWWAKATAPLHWLIYGLGAWGIWRMRPWLWPWAALYCGQIAVAMLVWNLIDSRGAGLWGGLAGAAVMMIPTVALWRAKPLFTGVTTVVNQPEASPEPSS